MDQTFSKQNKKLCIPEKKIRNLDDPFRSYSMSVASDMSFSTFFGPFRPKKCNFWKKIDFLLNCNSYYFWILGLALVLHFKNGSSENGLRSTFSFKISSLHEWSVLTCLGSSIDTPILHIMFVVVYFQLFGINTFYFDTKIKINNSKNNV